MFRVSVLPFVVAGLAVAAPCAALGQAEEAGKSLTLGGAVVVKPKYEGSSGHDVFGVPIIIPKFSDPDEGDPSAFKRFRKRVKFRGLDDIRFRVVNPGPLEFGVVGGYLSDRDQDDGVRLGGLGDVDGGMSLGGYAAVNVGELTFDVAAFDKVSGDDAGVQIRLGAEVDRRISERVKIVARVGTTFADEDYMQTYFGVTGAQAATSTFGLAAYDADSGIKDVHIELGTEVALNDRWLLKAGGRYGRLLGDAADSPVIETADQFSGTLGIGYRFNVGP